MFNIQDLKALFAQQANASNADAMAKYMKNHFIFYGVKTPERTALLKDYIATNPLPQERDTLRTLALALWSDEYREINYCAFAILNQLAKKPTIADIAFFEQLITIRSWWDSVDSLASVIGPALLKLPHEVTVQFTEKWIESPNMWVQRTAIIYQLSYRQRTDEARLFAYIQVCMHRKEFFLQKAIGWALRQYSRTNPQAVIDFIEHQPLAPLSKREGLRLMKKG